MLLFPNPAYDILTIDFKLGHYIGTSAYFEIVNIYGQVVKSKNVFVRVSQLDVSDLEAGTYFIRITQGSNQITERFVKL